MEVRFDNYRITTDKYNYMFQEYRGLSFEKKKGKDVEKWDTWGYWGSLDQLMRALPDMVIRRSEGTLDEALSTTNDFIKRLETALSASGYGESND